MGGGRRAAADGRVAMGGGGGGAGGGGGTRAAPILLLLLLAAPRRQSGRGTALAYGLAAGLSRSQHSAYIERRVSRSRSTGNAGTDLEFNMRSCGGGVVGVERVDAESLPPALACRLAAGLSRSQHSAYIERRVSRSRSTGNAGTDLEFNMRSCGGGVVGVERVDAESLPPALACRLAAGLSRSQHSAYIERRVSRSRSTGNAGTDLEFNMRSCGGGVVGVERVDAESLPPALACRLAAGLSRSQRSACAEAPELAALALRGARLAAAECAHQFRRQRWNCSALASRSSVHAAAIMRRGFRESAFAYAVTAAGAVLAVARGCAAGRLLTCGCAARSGGGSGKWKWGGCSHDIEFAARSSARLLDAREAAGDLHSRVNLHNNNAGRLAVLGNVEVRCKCHGLSGSCQLKTCWRAAPELRAVATALKRRHRTAVLVDRAPLNRVHAAPELRARRRPRARLRRVSPHSLLYYERSPSYCEPDSRLETEGTRGRECRAEGGKGGAGGCGELCCGRGHAMVRRTRTAPCRCRFTWCCSVHCQQCRRQLWTAVCK